ncbi:hypothetical protein [Salaquimonas pukyongi]|uniref:hypothetical protein n=1 Tax=Salaquimonas pukyongi TaxID=2712698 RepID=UPI0012EB0C87|nr:hypothetical protein [Salaquimonas pukyongi]
MNAGYRVFGKAQKAQQCRYSQRFATQPKDPGTRFRRLQKTEAIQHGIASPVVSLRAGFVEILAGWINILLWYSPCQRRKIHPFKLLPANQDTLWRQQFIACPVTSRLRIGDKFRLNTFLHAIYMRSSACKRRHGSCRR